MRTVTLGDTGRKTSQVGYGCSSLMGAMGRRASLHVLEAAYDAGIRHFDVAPMYGYGEAEACLGEFLKRRPSDVTITTKFGIEPPRRQGLLRLARRAVGPVLKAVPGAKQRLARAASAVAAPAEEPQFTSAAAHQSLERSLKALRVERIDLLLLHEVRADQLGDDALLRFLEDSVSSGKIASFGVGSERARTRALLAEHGAYCRTVQCEWSVLEPVDFEDSLPRRAWIHHRALTENFRALGGLLRDDSERARAWSQEIGTDLRDPGMLAALMVKAALERFPESVLLVSSKDAAHLHQNVRSAGDASLSQPALRLADLVQREHFAERLAGVAAC